MQQVAYVIGCFATPESDKNFGLPAVLYDSRPSDLVWEVGLFRSCLCSLKWPLFQDGVIFQCSFAGMGGMVGVLAMIFGRREDLGAMGLYGAACYDKGERRMKYVRVHRKMEDKISLWCKLLNFKNVAGISPLVVTLYQLLVLLIVSF